MKVEPAKKHADPGARARGTAKEIAQTLRSDPATFLRPNGHGWFRESRFEGPCRGYFCPIAEKEGQTEITSELLEELHRADRHRTFLLARIQSTRFDGGFTAGILLPKSFDVHREDPYPIVSVMPARDGETGVAAVVMDDRLRERIQPILDEAGLSDAVIVIPEIFGEVRDKEVTDAALNAWYREFLDEDVLPYVAARFRTESFESASYQLPKLQTARSKSKHASADAPCAIDLFEASAAKIGLRTPLGKGNDRSLRAQLLQISRPIVVPRLGGYAVESANERERSLRWKEKGLPPSREILENLQGHPEPTAIQVRIPRAGSDGIVPCTIFLPPRFSIEQPHELSVILTPAEAVPYEVGRELYESQDLGADVVAVIPNPSAFPNAPAQVLEESIRRVAIEEILPLVYERFQLGVSSVSETTVALDEKKSPIVQARKEVALDLRGPHVSVYGHWIQLPSMKMHLPFAPAYAVSQTEEIPKPLQKQPENHGALLAPIFHSEALAKDLRVGVYLPPSYDPSSDERVPVLLLLPGRNNPLHYWIEHGDIVTKLDRMMGGDAQRMIVVIPDGIDSFYVNAPAQAGPTPAQGNAPRKNAQDFVVQELVGWATTAFCGDPDRLSIGGISMGGFGAMAAAAMNPGMFRSVSAHSGVLGSHRNAGQNDGTDIAQPDGPNPTQLALAGSFDAGRTKIYLDVGAGDAFCRNDALELSSVLSARNVAHEIRVVGTTSGHGARKHDWEHWGPLLEDWIAFHQSASGKAGTPLMERAPDVTSEIMTRFAEDVKETRKGKSRRLRDFAMGRFFRS